MASDTAGSDEVDTAHRMSPGRAEGAQRRHRITVVDGDGRQRPLAHDHGVHELHRDVARVFRELGSDAPHRGSRREPPGERERGTGEVGTGLGAEATFDRRVIGHRALVRMRSGLSRTVPPNPPGVSGVP